MADIFQLLQSNLNDLAQLNIEASGILVGYEEYRFFQSLISKEATYKSVESFLNPTTDGGLVLFGKPVYATASPSGITYAFSSANMAAKYSLFINTLKDSANPPEATTSNVIPIGTKLLR
jgi:hypothetical protein